MKPPTYATIEFIPDSTSADFCEIDIPPGVGFL
jgi:hypothetical protein